MHLKGKKEEEDMIIIVSSGSETNALKELHVAA